MSSSFFTPDGAAYSSDRDNWETPQHLFDQLNAHYHFTIDVAANEQNHKCARYYTKADDGLSLPWTGHRVWCNPPYGRGVTARWVEKAYREMVENNVLTVMLIPARTGTTYFHKHILGKTSICFLKGRLKFELNGQAGDSAPFDSMIVVFNPDTLPRIVGTIKELGKGEQ